MRSKCISAKKFDFILRLLLVSSVAFSFSVISAFAGSDRFVDSDDYKSKEFKKGIIGDYADLQKDRDVEWAWIDRGVTLSSHKVNIESFEDATDDMGKSQLSAIKAIFKDNMEKLKGSKGALKADISVYEVQKYSPGKAWIPFAGGHQMQAGLGVEMVLKDKSGKIVAKFRHFAREGITVESAAEEVSDDLRKYLAKH